jgi:hypothetical protein
MTNWDGSGDNGISADMPNDGKSSARWSNANRHWMGFCILVPHMAQAATRTPYLPSRLGRQRILRHDNINYVDWVGLILAWIGR